MCPLCVAPAVGTQEEEFICGLANLQSTLIGSAQCCAAEPTLQEELDP